MALGHELQSNFETMSRSTGKNYKKKKLDMVAIGVNLPKEMFDFLNAKAKRFGTSFAEQVRIYLQWGVDSTEEE